MREICREIAKWIEEGKRVALAQVVYTWGSSPRRPGSLMAVASDGSTAGSVSGGCVEGSVIQTALGCLDMGKACTESFRASDTEAQSVGLSCGGSIDILVTPLNPALFAAEYEWLLKDQEYVRITFAEKSAADSNMDMPDVKKLSGEFLIGNQRPEESRNKELDIQVLSGSAYHCLVSVSENGIGQRDMYREIAEEIIKHLAAEPTGCVEWKGYTCFYSHIRLRPRLICVGAVHISVHLTQMARQLGYQTIVIDPRGIFSTQERFPFADRLMQTWPQEAFREVKPDSSTAVCVLSHDPKLDIPALEAALSSPAFYIGILGKDTTQMSRYLELKQRGFGDKEIKRIYGPIGLELGGREPSEIALSIMSQITMSRFGRNLPSRTMLESVREVWRKQNEK